MVDDVRAQSSAVRRPPARAAGCRALPPAARASRRAVAPRRHSARAAARVRRAHRAVRRRRERLSRAADVRRAARSACSARIARSHRRCRCRGRRAVQRPHVPLRCAQVVRRSRRAPRQWSLRTDESWALFLWSRSEGAAVAAEETRHYLANGQETTPDAREALEWARETTAKMVDLKFCDLLGTWQHVTLPISAFGESAFDEGLGFDGSSIRGWQWISESDMLLMPDPASAIIDPFAAAP